MLYRYVASDAKGDVVEEEIDAQNLPQVLQAISAKGLRPISVVPVKAKEGILNFRFGGITITDKVFLAKYLALMLRVGTDLLSAINILISDFDNPAMKNFLLEVRDNLTRGQPFYEAFARYPKAFPSTFVNLVKAAEASGNLQETFEDLSQTLSREAELQSRIRSALVYPVILLSAAFCILLFLVTFALPKVAKIFSDSGIEPPFFSRIVFGVGLFIGGNLIPLLLLLAIAGGGSAYFFFKTVSGRRIFDRTMSKMPLVKNLYREIAVQRFASTMSSLLKAGLPIIQTIESTAEAVGNEEFRYSLMRVSREGLAKGLTLGEAFRRETVFPKVVTNLVAISERAGHLEEVLRTLADFYAVNIDATMKSLTSVFEPVLLIGMGIMVLTIALSIIVPIYQLTTQF